MHAAFPAVGLTLVLGSASGLVAQSFDFPNFASVAALARVGTAAQVGNNLRLVNGGAAQTGSAWFATPVKVTEGFDTQFDFVLSPSPEGLAFVVQGSPAGAAAIGGGLWGMGYGFGVSSSPIPNSIAIEIDAIQNGFLNDTSGNEISVHTVGALGNSENEGVSIARITPAFDLSNGLARRMRISYVPGVLEVYVDNLTTPLLSMAFTFEQGGTQLTGGGTGGLGLAGTDAWVGFTSATSSTSSGQYAEIRSWSWVSFSLPDPCYSGNVRLGAGGPYDLVTINGTNGGFFRAARAALADPLQLAVAPPPGEASAPFLLLATIGVAGPASVTPTPYGTACFPLLFPLDFGGAVAPFALAVPPGLFLPPEMTFQALMATDASDPAQIELTNAIALQLSLAPAPTITNVTPNSAPPNGAITVNGNNFSLFATVEVNAIPVPPLAVSKTAITFPMPPGTPCGTTLRVRNPDGALATIGFNPTPVITSQANTSGPAAGGTSYIVIGQGFAPGTTVTIGGAPATVTSISAGVVVVITPPGVPGPAPVVITTPGGCSVTSTFTYL